MSRGNVSCSFLDLLRRGIKGTLCLSDLFVHCPLVFAIVVKQDAEVEYVVYTVTENSFIIAQSGSPSLIQ